MTTQGSINTLIRLKDRLKEEVTDNQTIMAALDIAIDALKKESRECPFCGYVIKYEEDRFCRECGAKIEKRKWR